MKPAKISLACTVVVSASLVADSVPQAWHGPCMAFAEAPPADAAPGGLLRLSQGQRPLVRTVGRAWQGRRALCHRGAGPASGPGVTPDLESAAAPCAWCCAAVTYYLDETLKFGPEDSGVQDAPVVYTAAAGENVVLSGGRRIAGGRWGEANGRKAWIVDIPEVKEGKWNFRQLFVNGDRRPRTRLPKQGEYRIESLPDFDKNVDPWDQDFRRFVFVRHGHSAVAQPSRRGGDGACAVEGQPAADPGVDVANRIVTFDRKTVGGLV